MMQEFEFDDITSYVGELFLLLKFNLLLKKLNIYSIATTRNFKPQTFLVLHSSQAIYPSTKPADKPAQSLKVEESGGLTNRLIDKPV